MAAAGTLTLKTENYEEQRRCHWPPVGRHILAHYDENCIVVYQAFCPEIADYAVQNGKFGGPRYSFTRMTWIKTNFLWMMYRSNWAQKKSQQRILAIYLTREGFDQILKFSKGTGIRVEGRTPGNVRIQWDPDHDPKGENQRRRAVQLGIKGIPQHRFHEQYIQHIEDITDFVKQQRQHVLKNELDKLITPRERVYRPSEEEICRHILLDEFHGSKTFPVEKKSTRGDTVPMGTFSANNINKEDDELGDVSDTVDGACCEALLPATKTKPVRKGHKEDLIVCLGGSFNPVHTGHIRLVETAIRWLEENSNYNVVAARLAVAPDSYVEKKYKRKGEVWLKAEHRIKLCELACKGHELIRTYYTTIFSARNCGENVRKWENLQTAKVAVVIGADKAVSADGHWRWHSKSKGLTVCVGRKGKTDIVRKAYLEENKEDLTSNPDFYMIEDELEDVNSTEIRRQLRKVKKDLKAAKNNKRIENSDVTNNMKGIESIKDSANGCTNTADRTVPVSWDELTDKENEPLNKDYTKSNIHTIKEQVENAENILSDWDELETEESVPSNWDELILDQDRVNENSFVCEKLVLQKEEHETRLNASTNSSSPKSADTVTDANKDPNITVSTKRGVVEDLVSKGWLTENVGEYILENTLYSDLN